MNNPHFDPPIINKPLLEKYFSSISKVTSSNIFNITSSNFQRNNLRGKLRSALRSLIHNHNIIIKEADKNLGIVILNQSWYHSECLRHLLNNRDYKQVNKDNFINSIYPQLISKYNLILKNIPKSNKYLKYLLKNNNNNKYPYFYIIPKVHKPILSSRPITASHSWVFTPPSAIIAEILNPFVEKTHTYLKNSNHLIDILQPLQSNHHNIKYIITGDVESLYTNIPLDILYKIIFNIIKNNSINIKNEYDMDLNTLDQLLRLVLNETYCEYNDQFYKQTYGIPMGTPCAPQLANLFLFYFEQNLIKEQCLVWKRFIDDILIIWDGEREDLMIFLEQYSSFTPSIKIQWTIREDFGEFLDLFLIIEKQQNSEILLQYKTHQKLLNTYLYVPFNSYHRRNVLKGFVRSELGRYKRNSSKEVYFLETKSKFYKRLRARGYPSSFLNPLFQSIDYYTHLKPKSPSPSLFLKIPYTPTTEKLTISSIINIALPDIFDRQEIIMRYSKLINFKISWMAGKHLLSYFNDNKKRDNENKKGKGDLIPKPIISQN